MRCPKCGYISFDHLEQCLKCKKNIKSVSDTLHGTVFHVTPPVFLQLSSRKDEDQDEDAGFVDSLNTDDEFVDDDLEVLVDDGPTDEDKDVIVTDDLEKDAEKIEKTLSDSDDSEDREIEIDMSQFEDAEELEGVSGQTEKFQETQPLTLDLPAELSDLSDLAPPKPEAQNEKSQTKNDAKKDAAGFEINDLDFDLGLGDLEADLAAGSDPGKETILALDDIDFSENLTKSSPKPAAKKSGADMDEDLNFDLDLGGLSLRKDI